MKRIRSRVAPSLKKDDTETCLPILPIGVVSKKDIGAFITTSNKCSNIDFEALTLEKLKSKSRPHVAKIALKLMNAYLRK